MDIKESTLLYDLPDEVLANADGPLYLAVEKAGYSVAPYCLINQWNCWSWTVGRFIKQLEGSNE